VETGVGHGLGFNSGSLLIQQKLRIVVYLVLYVLSATHMLLSAAGTTVGEVDVTIFAIVFGHDFLTKLNGIDSD
jgi:hypothetical protein